MKTRDERRFKYSQVGQLREAVIATIEKHQMLPTPMFELVLIVYEKGPISVQDVKMHLRPTQLNLNLIKARLETLVRKFGVLKTTPEGLFELSGELPREVKGVIRHSDKDRGFDEGVEEAVREALRLGLMKKPLDAQHILKIKRITPAS